MIIFLFPLLAGLKCDAVPATATLTIINESSSGGSGNCRLQGTILNEGELTANNIYIVIEFFDGFGNISETSTTFVTSSLSPGNTIDFDITSTNTPTYKYNAYAKNTPEGKTDEIEGKPTEEQICN